MSLVSAAEFSIIICGYWRYPHAQEAIREALERRLKRFLEASHNSYPLGQKGLQT